MITLKENLAKTPKTALDYIEDLKCIVGQHTNPKVEWNDEHREFKFKVLVKEELEHETIKALINMGNVTMKRSADGIRITIRVER